MTTAAKIIADSISPENIRLITMQLRYPKFIHGEFMTHRVFSRNASSSRAIPVERLIQDVLDDPVMPVFWGRNQKGMQAREECDTQLPLRIQGMPGYTANGISREGAWLLARDRSIELARDYSNAGYHKQIVNRLLEPWLHINVVCTATDWNNFFALRRHSDAQPEMKALADAMWDAKESSKPKLLKHGQWHLPYVDAQIEDDDSQSYRHHIDEYGMQFVEQDEAIKLSVARCARVSYLTTEGKTPTIEEDLKLYDRLVGSIPLHASPCEHQATPDIRYYKTMGGWTWSNPGLHGNLNGWKQYRKMLPNENNDHHR